MPNPQRRPATRMPNTDPPRPANDRMFGMLPAPGEIGAGLALLGLLAFVVCYSYERSFYETFTVSPDDVGQGYAVILGKAATGVALLAALAAPTVLAPWLLHHLRGRWRRAEAAQRSRLAGAATFALAITVTAVYGGVLASVAGISVLAGIGTGAMAGVAGAALQPSVPSAAGRERATVVVAGGSIVFLLLVVAASHAGATDSRRLLQLPRATGTASPWQTLLAMNTPAVTIQWTPPGATETQTTVGRLIGSMDGMLLVYDLQTCTLRRLTVDVSLGSRLSGSTLGPEPGGGHGSVLPRCPRDA